MRILISVQNIQARYAKIFRLMRIRQVMDERRLVHSLFFAFAHVLFAR
jgi:hypothetical protein